MPLVNLYMLDTWDEKQTKDISDAVHESLVEAFRIPDHDYNNRIIRLKAGEFIHSGRKTEKNIFVEIFAFPGRSRDAKKKLYAGIFRRLESFGIHPDDIMVIIHEPPLVNWGMKGLPGDEVDIGFKLDV